GAVQAPGGCGCWGGVRDGPHDRRTRGAVDPVTVAVAAAVAAAAVASTGLGTDCALGRSRPRLRHGLQAERHAAGHDPVTGRATGARFTATDRRRLPTRLAARWSLSS